ncbi:MAG: hypothetical protein KF760_26900 [Candidatus Eremiobacteraeota bacterium]|nr:hypothetical protein [Candidatus Eremiobacteraeota bacterium]MCW5872133.1 hypothetical protein [Candidatus Eremiobacteraeota bacterium]
MPTIHNLQAHNHHIRPAAPPARPQPAPQNRPEPRDQVELSPEAVRSCYTPPNESNDFVRDCREDRTPEVRQRQEATIRGALQSGGQPFELQNSAGQRESYTLRAGESGNYELRGQDGHTLNISLDERMSESDRVRALASISDFQSRIPAHQRDALDYVTVTNDAYPTSNGTLEGFARRSSITIYEGNRYLDNGVLDHEFGHVLGHKLVLQEMMDASTVSGDGGAMLGAVLFSSNTPLGWRGAVDRDGRAPSQYARDNGAGEDFAESYVAYREAQEEGPEAVEALRRQYPERVRYLEEVMTPPRTFFSSIFEGLW